jgi:apolipoprotein N-acyltransferase
MTFSRAPAWWIALFLMVAGAIHAMTFAPGVLPSWSLAALQILSLAWVAHATIWATSARKAFFNGWLFGFANFAIGLYWIFVSLHYYGGLAAPLAVAGVLVLSAFLALYPALACLIARWLCPPAPAHAPASAGALLVSALTWAAAWSLLEWIRATALTGFPWLNIGFAHVDSPIAGWAPLLGIHGMALIAAFVAATLAGIVHSLRLSRRLKQPINARHYAVCMGAFVLLITGWTLSQIRWSTPSGDPLQVRLIQGNVEQSQKFDPALLELGLRRHLELATLPARPADLIILPETVLPIFQDNLDPMVWQAWLDIAANNSASIAMGVPLRTRHENGQASYTNSVIGFNADTPLEQLSLGTTAQRYDKYHLVPWGEYVPPGFRWFTDMLNIPLGNFDHGHERQSPFVIRDQHIAFNICYEDLFGNELLPALHPSDDGEPGATILVNVSNLGWFGNTWALGQHLQIARLRTLETARPMLTVTNTGITAAISPQGDVTAQLQALQPGVLPVSVQGMTGLTPYALYGDKIALAIIVLLLVFAGARKKSEKFK